MGAGFIDFRLYAFFRRPYGCNSQARRKSRVEVAPQNRSFIFGEFAKTLDIVEVDASTSRGQYAALLPLGKQAAHGIQSRPGQLRQLLARKVDPERAVPVYGTPQLVKQAQHLMTQPCRHLFRGNLAVTVLEFLQVLRNNFQHIVTQRGEAIFESPECAGLPNQGGGTLACLCHGTVTILGEKPRQLNYIARPCEAENHL